MPQQADNTPIRPVTSFLFKGHNGTGKSIAACGKQFRPVYVFNCEGRIESVINYYRKLDGHCRDIEFDNYPVGSSYYALDQQFDKLIKRCEYKTVVMSSLTSFIYLILNHLIKSKAGQTTRSGSQAGRTIGGIPVNELQDYNAEDSGIINDLIAGFQELKSNGVNVILEAHITPYELVTLEEGQRVVTTINQILTKGKKAPASIPGFFNEMYLFYKDYEGVGEGNKRTKYRFTSDGTNTDDCKTSLDIKGFDFTGKDFSVEWEKQLSKEVLETPRVDPDAPKKVNF